MALNLIKCTKCPTSIFPDNLSGEVFESCPSCQSLLAIEIFPALLKMPAPIPAQAKLIEGQSSCFYHPDKTATVVCQSCGRFICGLCDLELNDRHLCPTCLEVGQKKSKFQDLENTRVLWDHLSLATALFPILFVWTSIIGAPAALYMVARYRKAPCSITGKSNARFIIASILAMLQIAAWILVAVLVFIKK